MFIDVWSLICVTLWLCVPFAHIEIIPDKEIHKVVRNGEVNAADLKVDNPLEGVGSTPIVLSSLSSTTWMGSYNESS
jgi:hypothetical protein